MLRMTRLPRVRHTLIALATTLPKVRGLASSSSIPRGGAFPVYFDSTNVWHRDLKYHAEQPERITACVQAIEKFRKQHQQQENAQWIDLIDVAPEGTHIPTENVQDILHQPFTKEELDYAKTMMVAAHSEDFVTRLEKKCEKAKQQRIEEGKDPLGHMGYIDFDTYVTTETFNVCVRAAAAWIRAVNNSEICMALMRPPGHHACKALQNGFCLYNFAAMAAIHYTLQHVSNRKVSILDWDVHYGQGIADIVRQFEHNIRYVSIHQVPAFPYQGEKLERPFPNVMTIPIKPDTTWTCGYKDAFQTALDFSCNDEWKPDLMIISAGYDALASEELASTSLNAANYGTMTTQLLEHIHEGEHSPRVMFGLEGGYQLNDAGPSGNLPDAVIETIKAAMNFRK